MSLFFLGSLNRGIVPGVLFLVFLLCVGGGALRIRGLVGFVIVVMGGTLHTLSIGPLPSEVVNSSTFCGEAGIVVAIVLRTVMIVCNSFHLAGVGSRWINIMSLPCT